MFRSGQQPARSRLRALLDRWPYSHVDTLVLVLVSFFGVMWFLWKVGFVPLDWAFKSAVFVIAGVIILAVFVLLRRAM